MPIHALSEAEHAQQVDAANEPRFAAAPPTRIVPMLADKGVYLARIFHEPAPEAAVLMP